MSHHIIEADNLSYHYPDKTDALDGINFSITHGESVALIGENGAGKSTLLMHLNGSLLASSGEMRIGHIPVTKRTLAHIRQSVGMVFQDSDDQLFMATVFDDVAFGPLNMGLAEAEVKRRAEAALATVGLLKLKDRRPYHLSGGEKRRIAIATVLAMEPNVLAMDEPSSGLDPKARRMLIKLLKSFKHTRIIASHDLDMIAEVCERTLVIFAGKVVADDTTEKIFADHELLKRCSLEPPLSMQSCPVCSMLNKKG
ncbi:MAG: energy-coupling factor ABC transporter ATP-binding protein [Victivallaceae bacterium]|nr:energy-coupling factor ABC transporter ATP-binding protein [Victivallaceae bacterium]